MVYCDNFYSSVPLVDKVAVFFAGNIESGFQIA